MQTIPWRIFFLLKEHQERMRRYAEAEAAALQQARELARALRLSRAAERERCAPRAVAQTRDSAQRSRRSAAAARARCWRFGSRGPRRARVPPREHTTRPIQVMSMADMASAASELRSESDDESPLLSLSLASAGDR